jgi:hypothetical protein
LVSAWFLPASPGFYPVSTRFLPDFYPLSAWFLPAFYQLSALCPPGFYLVHARVLHCCYLVFRAVHSNCFVCTWPSVSNCALVYVSLHQTIAPGKPKELKQSKLVVVMKPFEQNCQARDSAAADAAKAAPSSGTAGASKCVHVWQTVYIHIVLIKKQSMRERRSG